MSNVIVEGFATYGLGNSAATRQNLLAGAWAALGFTTGSPGLETLPWDAANTDIYLAVVNDAADNRRVLPVSSDTVIISFYYAVDMLPVGNNQGYIVAIRDGANATIAKLVCQSTGVLSLQDTNGTQLLATNGPVIVAETATHIEIKITKSTGTIKVNVKEVTVMNAGALAFTGVGNVAQLSFIAGPNALGTVYTQFISNLIVRNTSGAVNNDIVGDRRVATLFVNSDDLAHQGWAARARLRFGTGIMDNRASTNSCVTAASSAQTDLGSGDFTIEAQVRFITLPTVANKAVIFGKWDEAGNRRSYQLYMGGPSLESGFTTFRVSTDGLAGTVTEVISWPWTPETDAWQHVAISRASGETMFFINGVQQGPMIADAHTYFAGTATSALGAQDNNGTQVANTALNGFIDEFRLTVGFARYTTGFAPPVAAFPRGLGGDAHWANVAWLSGFDSGVFDESGFGRALTAQNGATWLTPNDGVSNYQTVNKPTPFDDTFIEAALIQATGILTQAVQPVAAKIVTLGTKDGVVPAVYTWRAAVVSAFDVLIDTTLAGSLSNLVAAITAGAGSGIKYGAGTTANFDVTAFALPLQQIEAVANTPGTAGNAIVSTTNDVNGSWTAGTLAGGVNIPSYSQFGFQRPPNETTIVDSITLVHRDFKTDAGTATVQASFVGAGGGVGAGAANPITTVPTYFFDTIEVDPDTMGGITPSTIVSGKVRMNRTA